MYSQPINNQVHQPQSGIWNGQQWVPIAQTSTPQQTALHNSNQTSQVTNSNLVQMYTQYYHKWIALHTEYSKHPAMESEAQWAKYHADLASRAAHYFHANPTITTAPSDFVLPPVPPVTISTSINAPTTQNNISATQYQQQPVNPFNPLSYQNITPQHAATISTQVQPATNAIQVANVSNAVTSQETPTDKMKRYVDRCLSRYSANPEFKALIMKEVEKIIMFEIQKGTLNSVDWDNKPLIEMPPQGTSTTLHRASSNGKTIGTGQSSGNYYGPSSSDPSESNSGNKPRKFVQNTFNRRESSVSSSSNNYYGPSSETNTLVPDDDDENDSENFISVPSYNKSIVNKKRKKPAVESGFSQSDEALSSRANRFAGKGDAGYTSKASTGEWDRYMGKSTIGGIAKKLDEVDFEMMTIRGTCQTLEKDYLRLTAPPRPELVRPLPILEQHLKNLKVERSSTTRDYLWFCSQLKAIRQDCTVQRIQNAFTIDVYETHARIALEENDLNEYNQCQTQLKELYVQFTKGNQTDESNLALRNQNEFIAYRLLYYIVLAMESHKHRSSSDIFNIVQSLTNEQLEDPIIKHALAVRETCCSDILEYHLFFRLLKESSNVGATHMTYLMNRIVLPLRYEALLRLCKAYRPTLVPVEFIIRAIGFDDSSENGRAFLQSYGCVFTEDGKNLNTKDTVVRESPIEDNNYKTVDNKTY